MKTTGLDNTIIEGLPEGTFLFSKEISKLAERGGYRLIAFPIRPGVLELQIHPGEGGSSYQCRDRWNSVRYRDPERTTLQTWDADTDISMTLAMPLSDIDTHLDTFGLPSDTVFRGMRNEEFTSIRETGQSWSKGELNMRGQEGMTCWTTAPSTAASYACSFAPMHCQPTFNRPAWVVGATAQPNPFRLPGMGSEELCYLEPVPATEIIAAWRGDVVDWDPGHIDLVKCEYGHWKLGSMVAASTSVSWTRLDSYELDLELSRDTPFSPSR